MNICTLSLGPTNNFHVPCTGDMRYVPFNRFIMTVENSTLFKQRWAVSHSGAKESLRVKENLSMQIAFLKI